MSSLDEYFQEEESTQFEYFQTVCESEVYPTAAQARMSVLSPATDIITSDDWETDL